MKTKQKNRIEISSHKNGDWVKMIINGNTLYEGHSIPTCIWLDVLEDTNFEVSQTEYSDEEDFE
jgi:hypothetical protein